MHNKEIYPALKNSLQEIERVLAWGPGSAWSDYDFDKLSDSIHQKTGVLLSRITLKRIWGRINYPHSPSLNTLNALAQFLDYKDWRDFSERIRDQTPAQIFTRENNRSRKKRFLFVAFIVGFLALIMVTFLKVMPKGRNEFELDRTKITGVPVRIKFRYSVKNTATNSIFIWPTWEKEKKIAMEKKSGEYTYTYYYPGFYRTKLMVDGSFVLQKNLQINTTGWLVLIEQPDEPFYFQHADFQKDFYLEIENGLLPKYGIPFRPTPPALRFYYITDFENLRNDQFEFETKVRSMFADQSRESEYIEIIIHCKDDAFIIPVCSEANSKKAYLYLAGAEFRGQKNELDNFSADITKWVHVKIKTEHKNVGIFINDRLVKEVKFPNDPSDIVGVQIRFNGSGSVKDTQFRNDEKIFPLK